MVPFDPVCGISMCNCRRCHNRTVRHRGPKTATIRHTPRKEGIYPPVSPFTIHTEHARCGWPLLPWVLVPCRGYDQQTPLRRAFLSYTSETSPKCGPCVTEYLEPADERLLRKGGPPLIGFSPLSLHRFKYLVQPGSWFRLIYRGTSLPPVIESLTAPT